MPAVPEPSSPVPGLRRPLIVTGHAELLDALLRLTAAAGVEPDVAPDLTGSRPQWSTAPIVLVGADVAARAQTPPSRRAGVLLVSPDADRPEPWQDAVRVGAEDVVVLPDAEQWLAGRLADAAQDGPHRAVLTAVIGGRGGAGATALAVALAGCAARRRHRCVLVDADPLGGGIDLALGAEDTAGLRWPDLQEIRGRLNGDMLTAALPVVRGLTVLSWDRGDLCAVPTEAMTGVLGAARRSADLVVVDLPRHVDAAVETVLTSADLTLLVVPAEVRATAAAARVATAIGSLAADLRVVVRGPAPSGLDPATVAGSLGLPLAGHLRPEPGLAADLDRGDPPGRRGRGPLSRFCTDLVTELLPAAPATRWVA